ncbi:MAG: winged helix-turn-helix domain-containing protein [Tateyamaria sp.]
MTDQVVEARFRFMDARHSHEDRARTKPPLYDLKTLDLSRLDRHALTLLDQQQDSRHFPVLALVSKETAIAQRLGQSADRSDPLSHALTMPRLAGQIQSMLDRMVRPSNKTLSAASLTVSPDTGQATFEGKQLALSRREIAALTLLVRHAPHAVPRERLQTTIYGSAGAVTSNAIEAVLSRLRRALKKAGCPARIVAMRGVGWCLQSPDDGKAKSQ